MANKYQDFDKKSGQRFPFLLLVDLLNEDVADEVHQYLYPTPKEYLYNKCYGGYGISEKAYMLYCERKGIEPRIRNYCSYQPGKRDDPVLVQIVKELGKEANGKHAQIGIDLVYEEYGVGMHEYDGIEDVGPSYQGCFVKLVHELLDNTELTDRQKILLMRQKRRDIQHAQNVYDALYERIIGKN